MLLHHPMNGKDVTAHYAAIFNVYSQLPSMSNRPGHQKLLCQLEVSSDSDIFLKCYPSFPIQ